MSIVLFIIGVSLCFLGSWRFFTTNRSRWRKTKCKSFSGRVVRFVELQPGGNSTLEKIWFRIEIQYSYELDGQKFQSNNLTIDPRSLWFDTESEAIAALNKIDLEDCCYVSKMDASVSVVQVELGAPRQEHWITVIVSGFLCIAVSLFFAYFNSSIG
jgi:hypothetical protein